MYRKSSQNGKRIIEFIFLDALCLQLALIAGYVFRHGFDNLYALEVYRNMALFTVLSDIAVSLALSTFDGVLYRDKFGEISKTLKHCAVEILVLVLYLFSVKSAQDFSRITFYLMSAIYPFVTYFARLVMKKFLRNHIPDSERRSILVVTSLNEAEQTLRNILSDVVRDFRISGLILLDGSDEQVGQNLFGADVVCSLRDMPEYVSNHLVDEVMIVEDKNHKMPENILIDLSKTGVVIHLNINVPKGMYGQTMIVEKIANQYTVATVCMKAATDAELFVKRLMDIAGGLFGCLVTAILCIFIAPAIKKASPGPVFFAQQRVGKNGRLFKMYKFRSMVPDADSKKAELESQNKIEGGLMFKMDFDPRVIGNEILPDGTQKTGIGDFIRRTSIDEFPQFLNVLLGSMSLVGTRPPTLNEYNEYSLHHKARMAVKPGITGMWQTSGRSEITDFEEVVALDTEYINNWSIWLDIKILLKTFKSVIKHDGAV